MKTGRGGIELRELLPLTILSFPSPLLLSRRGLSACMHVKAGRKAFHVSVGTYPSRQQASM